MGDKRSERSVSRERVKRSYPNLSRMRVARRHAWVMVVVFCVGVPGGCFLLLWRQRDKIMASEDKRKKDKSLDPIRSLFENYKPEHWFVRKRIKCHPPPCLLFVCACVQVLGAGRDDA